MRRRELSHAPRRSRVGACARSPRSVTECRDHLPSEQFQLPHYVRVGHAREVHATDQMVDAEGFFEVLDLSYALLRVADDETVVAKRFKLIHRRLVGSERVS